MGMYIITGAEGSGKTTVISALAKIMPFYWINYVSTTAVETPGVKKIGWEDYQKLAESDALEVSYQKRNALFGVTHQEITEAMKSGKNILWEIDLSVLENVKNDYPEAKIILLNGIGIEDLYERFENKGQTISVAIGMKANTLNSLNKSWHDAVDFVVDNRKGSAEKAAEEIKNIVEGVRVNKPAVT